MDVDVAQLKEREKAVWALGDYVKVAARLEPAARELVDACAVSAGQAVLDVAAGNGNVSVLAAREGAAVVACDITPAMVELGRMRTRTEGLDVEWVEADAEDLPFEDARFDCAASTFGAMFAPRPEVAARELVRVVRPGGTVGMANWSPGGFQGEMFDLMRRHGPPTPEGVPRPTEWGEEAVARARFEGLGTTVAVEPRTLLWAFDSPHDMWTFFGDHAGPAVALREWLDEEAAQQLRAEFVDLVERWNRAEDGSVAIDAEYALVVARRRG